MFTVKNFWSLQTLLDGLVAVSRLLLGALFRHIYGSQSFGFMAQWKGTFGMGTIGFAAWATRGWRTEFEAFFWSCDAHVPGTVTRRAMDSIP
jgi:hypothetical protein